MYLVKGLLLACLAVFITAPAIAGTNNDFLQEAAEAAKAREGNRISDFVLVDQDGKEFRLSSYIGKPLLVTFVYTTCPDICSSIAASLAAAMEDVRREAGDSFKALIIGFDWEYDTPEMMKAFAEHHSVDLESVRLASGDRETINKLTSDFGFIYRKTEAGGFNHLGLVSVVDSRGFLYRQIYKTTITPADIKLPVNQLLTGSIPEKSPPTFIDELKLLCLNYDPLTGKYYVDYAFIFGIFLQAAVLLIFIWIIFKSNIRSGLSRVFKRNYSNKVP